MRRLTKPLAVFTLALVLAVGSRAQACPNCKEAMANQTGEAAQLKDGYYYSILIMLGMPFALLSTGAFFVARAVKRGALPEF